MPELLYVEEWTDPGPMPADYAAKCDRDGFDPERVHYLAGVLAAEGVEAPARWVRALVRSRMKGM